MSASSSGRGTYAFDPQLVRRARNGDQNARRVLRRHTRVAAYPLALAVTTGPVAAARALRAAIDVALEDQQLPYASAVATALHSPPTQPPDEGRRARAVLALCDGGGLSQAAAARLLGMTRDQLAQQHARGRADIGLTSDPDRCAGWGLVCRDDELSRAEVAARVAHLSVCSSCTSGLRVRRLARRSTKVGIIGAAGLAAGVTVDAVLVAGAPAVTAVAIGAAALGAVGVQHVDPQRTFQPSPRAATAPGATPDRGRAVAPSARPTRRADPAPAVSPSPAVEGSPSPIAVPPPPAAPATATPDPSAISPRPAAPQPSGLLPTLPLPLPLPASLLPGLPLPASLPPGLPLPDLPNLPVRIPPLPLPLPGVSVPGVSVPGVSVPLLPLPLPSLLPSLLPASSPALRLPGLPLPVRQLPTPPPATASPQVSRIPAHISAGSG